MKLYIEYDERQVLLRVPPLENTHALRVILVDSGLLPAGEHAGVPPSSETKWTIPLAIGFWRQLVGFIERHYHTLLATASSSSEESGMETPLEFSLNGIPYACVADFPFFDEFERQGDGFELTQPRLRVSDPCYEKASERAFVLEARPGRWTDSVLVQDSGYGATVVAHMVLHESCPRDGLDFDAFEPSGMPDAGVTSGQCGFFDDAHYPDTPCSWEERTTAFYRNACAITLASKQHPLSFGTLDGAIGVVSHAYRGDGAYPVGVLVDPQGLVVGAMLWYLPEDAGDESEAGSVDDYVG